MRKIKIFSGHSQGLQEFANLEEAVNRWISEQDMGVEIIDIRICGEMRHINIVVHYRKVG